MNLAPFTVSTSRRAYARVVLLLVGALLSASAQAKAKAPAPKATAARSAAAASSPAPDAASGNSLLAAAASRYQGQFIAPCQQIAEGLYAQDLIELWPSGTQVNASYHKGMFSDANCQKSSLMVILHLPAVTWELDGNTVIDGVKADTVTVTLRAGPITASVIQEDAVRQDMEQIVIKAGAEELPINRQAEGSIDKDIRLLRQDSLHFGDPEHTDAKGYPKALLQPPFTRNLTPPSP